MAMPGSISTSSELQANILLVDDNPANLLALRAILDNPHYCLTEARSGDEAIQRLQSADFAVVLLDVLMPGISGFETARQIRQNERLRRTPIIFLTAADIDREQIEEGYSLGAVDLLVKPFSPIILRAKVQGFVELFEERAKAKRESEQRFSRFMKHLPGLAWIKDAQGRYVYVNDAAEKAFQRPREALYGKTDQEIFDPATAHQFVQNDERARSSGIGIQAIESLQQPEGLRYSLVSKFPITGADGHAGLVGGMAIDITKQMEIEQALRESEQRFRGLMEQAPFSVQVFSPDGRTHQRPGLYARRPHPAREPGLGGVVGHHDRTCGGLQHPGRPATRSQRDSAVH
jgi:PAS domain S-box-containing protein